METLRPALSCIQGPVDTHSHVPQQRSPYWARTSRRQGFRWQALIWRQGKSWGNISFAAGWRPTPPVLETWPWLLNGASVCCHRPADQGVGTGVGGGASPDASSKLIIRVIYTDEFQAANTISSDAGKPCCSAWVCVHTGLCAGMGSAGAPHSHP